MSSVKQLLIDDCRVIVNDLIDQHGQTGYSKLPFESYPEEMLRQVRKDMLAQFTLSRKAVVERARVLTQLNLALRSR